MPKCSRCCVDKSLDDFPKSKTCVSGFRSYCRVCKNEQTRSYYEKDKLKHRVKADQWTKNNHQKVLEIKRRWKQNNPEQRAVDNAKRQSLLRTSSILWDLELTNFVFQEAQSLRLLRNKLTNLSWHVDHVIPLKGKLVCGLHVWNNFAVIPAVENLRKHNKYAISEERRSPV